MKKWIAAVLLVFAVVAPARGDSLTISAGNLDWNGIGSSPTYTIGIQNPTSTAQVLYAWQLGLAIVPEAGATGSLEFASATVPGNNYVLASIEPNTTGLLPVFSGPSTSISLIGDASSANQGVSLAAGSSYDLLSLTFVGSRARGVFDIEAMPVGLASGSGWYSSNFNAQGFANANLGPVTVGQASIPEPQSVVLLLSGLLTLLACRLVRRGRGRVA